MVELILACLPVVTWPAAVATLGLATLRLVGKFLDTKAEQQQQTDPEKEELKKQVGELNDRVNAISLEIGFGERRK